MAMSIEEQIESIQVLPNFLKNNIEPLVSIPKLGNATIGYIEREGSMDFVYSNCFGTLAYCYDIGHEPLNIVSYNGEPPVSFPVERRPGYLD